jgi:hypothetical protein
LQSAPSVGPRCPRKPGSASSAALRWARPHLKPYRGERKYLTSPTGAVLWKDVIIEPH